MLKMTKNGSNLLSQAFPGSLWLLLDLSLSLSLALYGSLWLPLWLSLALTSTLWLTLALSFVQKKNTSFSPILLDTNLGYLTLEWLRPGENMFVMLGLSFLCRTLNRGDRSPLGAQRRLRWEKGQCIRFQAFIRSSFFWLKMSCVPFLRETW